MDVMREEGLLVCRSGYQKRFTASLVESSIIAEAIGLSGLKVITDAEGVGRFGQVVRFLTPNLRYQVSSKLVTAEEFLDVGISFCMSLWEGEPNIVLEASALNVPTVGRSGNCFFDAIVERNESTDIIVVSNLDLIDSIDEIADRVIEWREKASRKSYLESDRDRTAKRNWRRFLI